MKFYTVSAGILARKAWLEPVLGHSLHMFKTGMTLTPEDVLLGWGQKAGSRELKEQARQRGVAYWHLEDGFIGYIGHPARQGIPVSLIADPVGIYYDARQPSHLEQLIATPCSGDMLSRAAALKDALLRLGVTKYNCYDGGHELPGRLAASLQHDPRPMILLIDQVAGDLSIPGALASEADFISMVETARRRHPGARLLLRTHPDTCPGRKRGVLARLAPEGVEIITDHCHPHTLLSQAEAVYTVSSQMGFEALLMGKTVYCFGMPFYAGWGLTHDSKVCARRRGTVSLLQLVAAALIQYPRYLDPVLGRRCEVEEVLPVIARQQHPAPPYRRLYLAGFSLWKRAFLRAFCSPLAKELRFVRKPPAALAADERVAVWGSEYPELAGAIRVEDGFIRSRGLGSDLCRPSSLCLDPVGIYFDSRRPSEPEQLLSQRSLTEQELARGEALIGLLRRHGVSKYNVGSAQPFTPPADGRERILVVGQVDDDASVRTGSPEIRSNEALLWAVRAARPQAHILFKPHPDVVAGNRAGTISAPCLAACVDSLVTDISLTRLYPHVDELHTMTSLSGFEALIHGVRVTTWGQPFYSGWGLTEDICPPARRGRAVSLAALVYITLVVCPRYIDWRSGLWMSPEQLIHQLAAQGSVPPQTARRWPRWRRRLSHLAQIFRP